MREAALAPVGPVVPERYAGLEWVDRLKGVAMLWVVLNHIVEQLAGIAYAADPTGDWPPLAQRIAQFRAVSGFGALDIPLTVARDVGWLADQAVSLFIILSGFGLALGLLARNAPASIDVATFVRRRVGRIYPMWWVAHGLLVAIALLVAARLPTGDWQFYASFAGLRFLPAVFSYTPSSWWYVGLILQLYIVFPFMWRILRARGPLVLLSLASASAFAALALGHALIGGDALEMWQRGICCFTRLGEFAFGMALATWWARDSAAVTATMRRPAVRAAVVLAYVGAIALTFTLPGMIVAPMVLGVAALVLLYPVMAWRATGHGFLAVVGRHSFSIYLAHQYFVNLFVRPNAGVAGAALGIVLALVAAFVATLVLERATSAAERIVTNLRARRGTASATAIVTATLALAFALSIALNAALRIVLPRERDPAPASFALRPVPGSTEPLRILVAGRVPEAAQKAAGDAAWAASLASELTAGRAHVPVRLSSVSVSVDERDRSVATVRTGAQRFRPDVVLVQVTEADVRDVAENGDSVFSLPDIRKLESELLVRPLLATLMQPGIAGTTVSNYVAVLHRRDVDRDGVRRAAAEYRDIATVAAKVGARTIVGFMALEDACGRGAPSLEELARLEHRALAVASAANLPFVDLNRVPAERRCAVSEGRLFE